ncbi:MAG: lipopolysaccharide biosynthesis protein [Gaiellaceae bacterium]
MSKRRDRRLRADPRLDGAGQGSGETLRRSVVSGLLWKGTSQITTQVTRFGVAVILARLLSPHDYGIAGMVLVFMAFVLVFSDFALGNTLVQRRELTDIDSSTAFWTSVGAGATFTVGGILLAQPVASFFGEPTIRPMIMVLSLSFLVQSLGVTQSALLVRDMAFRGLELREMTATIIGGAAGVALALRGAGAWAIIAQQLTGAVIATALVWHYAKWKPSTAFSRQSLRGFAGFSANVFGTNVAAQLRGTTDNVLIGRVIGPAALGSYALAYNLVLVPFNRIAVPLSQVLFPALSRVQDDRARIGELWTRSLRLVAAIALPSCVGLLVVGADVVEVVLGTKWHSAAPIVQLLAVVGLLQTLQFLNPIVLQAVDRTSILLRWSLVSYGATLVAFIIGLHWGAVGVAAAYAVVSGVTEPLYARATARAIGLPFSALARAVSGPLQAATIMAVALVAVRLVLAAVGAEPEVRLPVLVVGGIASFAAGLAWRAGDVRVELGRLLGRRRQETGDAVTASKVEASSAAR